MKFSINGTQYRVRFGYQNEDREFSSEALRNSRTKPVTTTAEIQHKVSEDKDGWEFITDGRSTCSTKDPFVKDTGRKKALERALQKSFCKNDRRVIWRAYFENHRGIKPAWFLKEKFENLTEDRIVSKLLKLIGR